MKRVDALGHQVLDLADLGGGVVLRVDDDDLDAFFLGLFFDAELDLVEEVGLQVGNGKADLLDLLRPRRRAATSATSGGRGRHRAGL